jgi:tetratricopeptide (TPR) repeat protein
MLFSTALLSAALLSPGVAMASPSLLLGQAPGVADTPLELAPEDRAQLEQLSSLQVRRAEEIQAAESLLSSMPASSPQKPEIAFRLAELYGEEARFYTLKSLFESEACLSRQDSCEVPPSAAEATEWLNRSEKLYTHLLIRYPDYARSDEALYGLAYVRLELGKKEQANEAFTQLVRRYPDSEMAADAYFNIGEYWFEKEELYKALPAYQRAAAYTSDPRAVVARYKLAWVHYNIGAVNQALDEMMRVVAQSEALEGTGQVHMKEEAEGDMVRFCAESGRQEDCLGFFASRGQLDRVAQTLDRLSVLYLEQGKTEEAVQMLGRLVAMDPQGLDTPALWLRMAVAWREVGQVEASMAAFERAMNLTQSGGTWERDHAAHPEELAAHRASLAEELGRSALKWHREGMRVGTGAKALESAQAARVAYAAALQLSPAGPMAGELAFGLAELNYTLKDYALAHQSYARVLALGADAKRTQFVISAMVFASAELVEDVEAQAGGAPVELSPWAQVHLEDLDRLAAQSEEPTIALKALYRSGYLLIQHNHFEEAAARFTQVIERDPGAREAVLAANLVLDELAAREQWVPLRDMARSLLAQQVGSQRDREELRELLSRAEVQVVEAKLAEDGDYGSAAHSLQAIAQEFQDSGARDLMLHNAALYAVKVPDLALALSLRDTLIQEHPDSAYVRAALGHRASLLESSGRFEEAADAWMVFAQSVDGEEEMQALEQAAWLYARLGQPGLAAAALERLEGQGLQVGALYVEAGDGLAAQRVLEPVVLAGEMPMSLQARVLLASVVELGVDVSGEMLEAPEGLVLSELDSVSLEALGLLRLRDVTFRKEHLESLPLSGSRHPDAPVNEALLGRQTLAKFQALMALEQSVSLVIETGAGEAGVDALLALGQGYEGLAADLLAAPPPPGMEAGVAEQYALLIQDRADMLLLKAEASYEASLDQCIRLGLYGQTLETLQGRLGELNPERYAPAVEQWSQEPVWSHPQHTRAPSEVLE